MNIEWKFDDEGEWDPFTLLGSIRLEDDYGNIIEDECTIIDSWFIAISKGLEIIATEHRVEIDLLDEPDPLIFISDGEKLEIRYKDQGISLRSISNVVECFKKHLNKFIHKVESYPCPRDEFGIAELNKILKG